MAEWVLAIVGAFILIAIWHQARETSRSVKTAQKSLELQEILHRQWVNVEHWKGDADFASGDQQAKLKIGFDVLNPTSMPVTLDYIQATIASCHNAQNFDQAVKSTLAPQKAYAITIGRMLCPEEVSRLSESGLQLTVSGSIRYTDAFENKRTQQFAIVCAYSARGASFTPWEGTIMNEPTHLAGLPHSGEAKARTHVYARAAYGSALRLIERTKGAMRFRH